MIGYITLGSNDMEKAKGFYDAVLAELGAKRGMAIEDRMQFWANDAGMPMFGVCKPYDEKPATVGNGQMISLFAPTRDVVDKTHAKALASGGTDEGAPGPRGDAFYGAYFRDLDGNKVCVFNMG